LYKENTLPGGSIESGEFEGKLKIVIEIEVAMK
jgi:hypothetical protein